MTRISTFFLSHRKTPEGFVEGHVLCLSGATCNFVFQSERTEEKGKRNLRERNAPGSTWRYSPHRPHTARRHFLCLLPSKHSPILSVSQTVMQTSGADTRWRDDSPIERLTQRSRQVRHLFIRHVSSDLRDNNLYHLTEKEQLCVYYINRSTVTSLQHPELLLRLSFREARNQNLHFFLKTVIKKSNSVSYLVNFNMGVGRQKKKKKNLFLKKKKRKRTPVQNVYECVWSGCLFTSQWLLARYISLIILLVDQQQRF